MGWVVFFGMLLFAGLSIVSAQQKKNKQRAIESGYPAAVSSTYNTASASSRRLEPEEFAGYFETSVFETLFGAVNTASKPYWMAVKIRIVPAGLMLFPPLSPQTAVPRPPVTVMWDAIESAGRGGASSAPNGTQMHSIIRLLLAKLDDSHRTPVGTIAMLHLYDPGGRTLERLVTSRLAERAATMPRPAPPVGGVLPAPHVAGSRPASPPPSLVTKSAVVSAPVLASAAPVVADEVEPAAPAAPPEIVHPGDNVVMPEITGIEVASIPDYSSTYTPSTPPTYEPTDFSTPYAAQAIDHVGLASDSSSAAPNGGVWPGATPPASGLTITPPSISAPWPPPQQFVLPDAVRPDAHVED